MFVIDLAKRQARSLFGAIAITSLVFVTVSLLPQSILIPATVLAVAIAWFLLASVQETLIGMTRHMASMIELPLMMFLASWCYVLVSFGRLDALAIPVLAYVVFMGAALWPVLRQWSEGPREESSTVSYKGRCTAACCVLAVLVWIGV